ncbi:hypothetical protein [Polluticaenibacter yanchengensis]|uniref:Uncharacterized protein n=1 Tax=Polluticaenibacter yanchengensis TaxID=3014562 RepID=A0ABT4UKA4_9BACT|nr:hypothetical protein [Chitinophagaceae bacterium LY-5]
MAALFTFFFFSIWIALMLYAMTNRTKRKSKENLPYKHIVKNDPYLEVEYVNKHSTNLDDFIINDEINAHDLKKLAALNGIELSINEGWYPLVIELIKELYANGWDKKIYVIKEKYASLRFSTKSEYGSVLDNIITKYEEKSKRICETCGKDGFERISGGWLSVLCRYHYLKCRNVIRITQSGFIYNKKVYNWNEISNIGFDDKKKFLNKREVVLDINFRDSKDYLLISNKDNGFGEFINNLSEPYRTKEVQLLNRYRTVDYCEICGYLAVYDGYCECCENATWENFEKVFKYVADKAEYIYDCQLDWHEDEGELYESERNIYIKNPDYKIYFARKE